MSGHPPPTDFGFGSDEEMLRDLARKFLDEQLPVEALRTRWWPAITKRGLRARASARPGTSRCGSEIVELGWTGLAVPERSRRRRIQAGGRSRLVEEVGRHALPSPLIATLNATYVALRSRRSRRGQLARRIADGTTAIPRHHRRAGKLGARAPTSRHASDGRLASCSTGVAYFVQDAFKVDAFLVARARSATSAVLCVVPAERRRAHTRPGSHPRPDSRPGNVALRRTCASRRTHIVSRDGVAAIERAWPSILVTAAADLCGCASGSSRPPSSTRRTRKQFDRPIGFFQAVKHPLVNAMLEIDRARSLLYHAACCIDVG